MLSPTVEDNLNAIGGEPIGASAAEDMASNASGVKSGGAVNGGAVQSGGDRPSTLHQELGASEIVWPTIHDAIGALALPQKIPVLPAVDSLLRTGANARAKENRRARGRHRIDELIQGWFGQGKTVSFFLYTHGLAAVAMAEYVNGEYLAQLVWSRQASLWPPRLFAAAMALGLVVLAHHAALALREYLEAPHGSMKPSERGGGRVAAALIGVYVVGMGLIIYLEGEPITRLIAGIVIVAFAIGVSMAKPPDTPYELCLLCIGQPFRALRSYWARRKERRALVYFSRLIQEVSEESA